MAKRKKTPWMTWRAGDSWEVNMARVLEAKEAARRTRSASVRDKMSRSAVLRHKRERRAKRRRLNEWLANRQAETGRPLKGLQVPIGTRQIDRAVRVMEPGRWYSHGELLALSGVAENGLRSALEREGRRRGLIDKALDANAPAGRRNGHRPRLWRLSEAGERWRGFLELL